jgi:hypothetical protein
MIYKLLDYRCFELVPVLVLLVVFVLVPVLRLFPVPAPALVQRLLLVPVQPVQLEQSEQ